MAKSASPADLGPDPVTAPQLLRLRKSSAAKSTHARRASAPSSNAGTRLRALAAAAKAPSVKPLLIGVGIGAALVGGAVAMHSQGEKAHGLSPFRGPRSALAGVLTKTALFALARVVSGQAVRVVATRALLEVADAWKA